MINIKSEGIILQPTDLAFEDRAVLNPAAIEVEGVTHLFYRAVARDGVSSIGYCRIDGSKIVSRSKTPVLFPEFDYESRGLEDPRVTFLDGTYYLLYTAFDGTNARIAYAKSSDLVHFQKMGLISANINYHQMQEILPKNKLRERLILNHLDPFDELVSRSEFLWEKDACLFPQKFSGKFALLHRLRPDIQIVYFSDFAELTTEFWETYLRKIDDYIVLEPEFTFENLYIGGGCPPVATDKGWLFVYHAVEKNSQGRVYHAAVALLDRDDPRKVIARLPEPLFSPSEPWEKVGQVNNVVFPTGTVVKDGRLEIYYGAADNCIGKKSVDINELLSQLEPN